MYHIFALNRWHLLLLLRNNGKYPQGVWDKKIALGKSRRLICTWSRDIV